MSPHERPRSVRPGPVPFFRNPLEPAGEGQQGGGHRSARHPGVCPVRVSSSFKIFLNVHDVPDGCRIF